MTLYSKIESLCHENNISMQALSRRADVDRGTIEKWRDGIRSPRVYTLKRIADYFGVMVDDLLPENQ